MSPVAPDENIVRWRLTCLWLLAALLCGGGLRAAENHPQSSTAGIEFFEKKIRPLLIQHCDKCHAKGPRSKSDFRMDSREGLLHGGKRGPAIVPGDPEASLLLQAVRHKEEVTAKQEDRLRMPPKGKLTKDEITDLETWIRLGVPWPEETKPRGEESHADDQTVEDEEFVARWAFRPPKAVPLPRVSDARWCQSPIDRFILARLEAAHIKPAPRADRRTLLRRATFDLTGLPPTPEEIDAFLQDTSSDAFAKVVDRLLASPRYGERWGRHWLDLVRYAETDGHEFDPDKPGAYHYRDYVIESLNDDLPYDRFITEQLAGDGFPRPRLSADGSRRASEIATAFYWLGELQNVPVDQAASDANVVENQIDVIGKAFLGLTLACARCHDHKFDPISTEDYYALAGILDSSRRDLRCVDSATRVQDIATTRNRIESLNGQINQLAAKANLASIKPRLARLADDLLAAREVISAEGKLPPGEARAQTIASQRGLDAVTLQAWSKALRHALDVKDPIFYPWARLSEAKSRFDRRRQALAERLVNRLHQATTGSNHVQPFEDFEADDYDRWTPLGAAFGTAPTHPPSPAISGIEGNACASSFHATDALTGRLVSKPFVIQKPYVHFRIGGGNDFRRLRFSLMINGQPLPEITATGEGDDRLRQSFFEAQNLRGRTAYFEIVDEDSHGHIFVDEIAFADGPPAKKDDPPNRLVVELLKQPDHSSPELLARAYQKLFSGALSKLEERLRGKPAAADWWRTGDRDRDQLSRWLLSDESPLAVGKNPAASLDRADRGRLATLRRERKRLENACHESAIAMVTADGQTHDVAVQIRGNPHSLGDVVPRRFLAVLSSVDGSIVTRGSGRRELADWITAAENPLTARVAVNRVWQHHFGRGIVATSENFGRLGERPTHPALLDFLALRFVQSGWSFKALHRLMMLSSTYQQASDDDSSAAEADPANRLWHRMPVRRLEAEAIRDSMLAVAGTLDDRLYGPSVMLHLTPYMEGRSLPRRSGPLDGAGRRSIYLEVRRNHLTPLLSVFDFPQPTTPTARRDVSAVPPMALAMMNNDFVVEQARVWAHRLLDEETTDEERIDRMFRQALGRPPREDEIKLARRFLREQTARYRKLSAKDDDPPFRAWADLCQVLFDFGEFFFIR